MPTQQEKAERFVQLHAGPRCFLIPNPWDSRTTKILAGLGYEAMATTSLGVANVLGHADVTRDEVIANAREIVEATDLPVNADLENCFAHEPAAAAERKWLANPPTERISSYTLIYGNKMAVISISKDDTPYGVVIEDAGVANMQRLLFDQLWAYL